MCKEKGHIGQIGEERYIIEEQPAAKTNSKEEQQITMKHTS